MHYVDFKHVVKSGGDRFVGFCWDVCYGYINIDIVTSLSFLFVLFIDNCSSSWAFHCEGAVFVPAAYAFLSLH